MSEREMGNVIDWPFNEERLCCMNQPVKDDRNRAEVAAAEFIEVYETFHGEQKLNAGCALSAMHSELAKIGVAW